MRLESPGAVYTGSTLKNKKEINNIEIDMRGLCQYVDRHKKWI